MTAEDDKPIGELTPRTVSKWRGLAFTLGGMGVVIAGVVLAIVVSTSQAPPASAVATPSRATHLSGTAIGKDGNPKYNQQLVEDNERRVAEAQSKGQSFIPTPVGQVQPNDPIQPAEAAIEEPQRAPSQPPASVVELPAATTDAIRQTRTTAPPYRMAAHVTDTRSGEARGSMEQYLAVLGTSWQVGAHVRQVAQAPTVATEGIANPIDAGATASSNAPSGGDRNEEPRTVRVGDVLYARNVYEVNSDIDSPVVARIVSGEWRDAKLIGQFKLQSDYLVLEFDQLALGDLVVAIKAVAVDPQTQQYAVRSEVDHHRLARWGSFLAGSWLATFGEKLEQSGTTTVVTTGSGGTTTVTEQPQFDTRAINQIALGRLGREVANEVRGQLSRPATVKLRAKADLGVLILSAPRRDQQLPLTQQSG